MEPRDRSLQKNYQKLIKAIEFSFPFFVYAFAYQTIYRQAPFSCVGRNRMIENPMSFSVIFNRSEIITTKLLITTILSWPLESSTCYTESQCLPQTHINIDTSAGKSLIFLYLHHCVMLNEHITNLLTIKALQ